MPQNNNGDSLNYKINEETGNRIYAVRDGLVPKVMESDSCSCADVDCSYVRSVYVWVYPHGDKTQKIWEELFDYGSRGLVWGFGELAQPVCIDDEWEYEGEEQEPEKWGDISSRCKK